MKVTQPAVAKKEVPVKKTVEKLADTVSHDPFRNDAGNKTDAALDEMSNIEKNQVDA